MRTLPCLPAVLAAFLVLPAHMRADTIVCLVEPAPGKPTVPRLELRLLTPGLPVTASHPISGLQAGESLFSIDFRPLDGLLYGLGSTSRLYQINLNTGAATAVNAVPFVPPLSGLHFGFDVNPVFDYLRVVSDGGQNLRLSPVTGLVLGNDIPLSYAPGDPFQGQAPHVSDAASDNNFAGALSTTLFDIDTRLGILVRQGSVNGLPVSPNSGQLTTIGPLGFVPTSDISGFDIFAGTGTAYGAFDIGGTSQLFTINLNTGSANFVSNFPGLSADERIWGIAIKSIPEPASVWLSVVGLMGLADFAARRQT